MMKMKNLGYKLGIIIILLIIIVASVISFKPSVVNAITNYLFPTGRTATYVIAASDATAQEKAQADYVCDGINDATILQKYCTSAASNNYRIVGTSGTYALRSGITISGYNSVFDFSNSKFTYSGTGTAVTITGSPNSQWLTVNIGKITAVGAAVSSATAKGLVTKNIQWCKVSATVMNFNAGTGIDQTGSSGNGVVEANTFWFTAIDNLIGLIMPQDYNTYELISIISSITNSINVEGYPTNTMMGIQINALMTWLIGVSGKHLYLPQASNGIHINTWNAENQNSGSGTYLKIDAISQISIDNYNFTSTGSAQGYCEGYIGNAFVPTTTGKTLAANPTFDSDTNGWSVWQGTLAWEAAQGYSSIGAASVVQTTNPAYFFVPIITAYANQKMYLSFAVKSAVAGAYIKPVIQAKNSGGTSLGYVNPIGAARYIINNPGVWYRVTCQFILPASTAIASPNFECHMPDNINKIYFDDVFFTGLSAN